MKSNLITQEKQNYSINSVLKNLTTYSRNLLEQAAVAQKTDLFELFYKDYKLALNETEILTKDLAKNSPEQDPDIRYQVMKKMLGEGVHKDLYSKTRIQVIYNAVFDYISSHQEVNNYSELSSEEMMISLYLKDALIRKLNREILADVEE